MIDKKALAESALALLIIAIITMGILGIFVYQYTQRQTCQQKIELCRTSITYLNAYKKTPLSIIGSVPKIDCPICVPDSSKQINTNTEQDTMQQIADHVRWCWYKTTTNDNTIGTDLGKIFGLNKKDVNFCLVCSEFKTNTPINSQQFLNYLNTQKISTGPGQDLTYADYFGDSIMKTKEQQKIPKTESPTTSTPEQTVAITIPTTTFNPSQTEPQSLQSTTAQIATTSQEEQQKYPERYLPVSLEKDKTYQVIAQNINGKENHLLIVDSNEVSQIKTCEIYHYQKE